MITWIVDISHVSFRYIQLVLYDNLFHKVWPGLREDSYEELFNVWLLSIRSIQRFPNSVLEDMSVGGEKSLKGMSHLDYFHFWGFGTILLLGVTINNLMEGVKKTIFFAFLGLNWCKIATY